MASPSPFTPKHSSPFPGLSSPLSSSSPSPTPRSPHPLGPRGSSSHDSELTLARKWIEECTGRVEKNKSFKEYLQDGTLLCELVQNVRPDLIRKIKRVRSPFAWRENLSFFLEACKSLGLKGSQLFSPEDLIASGARTPTIKT
ncbi:LIM and calponin homology domains-containing protein 1 [Geodia barretti]|nr:LIM and calponin homology domains-containing protein 1 [Geodia barretti]